MHYIITSLQGNFLVLAFSHNLKWQECISTASFISWIDFALIKLKLNVHIASMVRDSGHLYSKYSVFIPYLVVIHTHHFLYYNLPSSTPTTNRRVSTCLTSSLPPSTTTTWWLGWKSPRWVSTCTLNSLYSQIWMHVDIYDIYHAILAIYYQYTHVGMILL